MGLFLYHLFQIGPSSSTYIKPLYYFESFGPLSHISPNLMFLVPHINNDDNKYTK